MTERLIGWLGKGKGVSWEVYRRLLRHSLAHWELMALIALLLVTMAYLSALYPKVVGTILDQFQADQPAGASFKELVEVCCMLAIVVMLQQVALTTLEERVFLSLKLQFFQWVLHADMAFFDRHRLGEVNSRLGNDISQAKAAVSSSLCHFLRNSLTFLCVLAAQIWMSPGLSLLVLGIYMLLTYLTMAYTRAMKDLIKEYQQATAEGTATSIEAFQNIHLIKSRCTEDKESFKMEKVFHKCWDNRKRQAWLRAGYRCAAVLLPDLAVLAVLAIGTLLVRSQFLRIGELTSFLLYSSQLATNAKGATRSLSRIINGTAAIERVTEMMQTPILVTSPAEGHPLVESDTLLQLKSVSFKYRQDRDWNLKDLNLKVQSGEFVAIVGGSGCGKSTLFKLLLRFYDPQEGEVLLCGRPYPQYQLTAIRQAIAYVGQQPYLFSGTIRENLLMGGQATDEQLKNCLKAAGADVFLNEILYPEGLDTLMVERGGNLSEGERQKLSIARAVLRQARLFLFDEPTSAQDSKSEVIIQQLLANLSTLPSRPALLVIAHRFSTIEWATRIVLMQQGTVRMTGLPSQLKEGSALYNKLLECELKS